MGHAYPRTHKSQYRSSVKLCRESKIVLSPGSLIDGLERNQAVVSVVMSGATAC